MKTCNECGEEQPLTAFRVLRRSPDGKNPKCKRCMRRNEVPSVLRYEFQMTLQEFAWLLHQQDCRCALCNEVQPHGVELSVDHDHHTNAVRALLCVKCNSALERMERAGWPALALEYLRWHRLSYILG